jgi:mRNA interferase MazF
VLIVQSDSFNRSRLATVMIVVLTANVRLLDAPGNVLLRSRVSGLPRDSVANVSQVLTIDRRRLAERIGHLPADLVTQVDAGLRLVLAL